MSSTNEWPEIPENNAAAYQHGYKDGVQMVGTGGRTLLRALAEIDMQEREAKREKEAA